MPSRRQATAEGVSQLMAYFYPIQEFLAEGGTAQQAWGLVRDIEGAGGPTVDVATFLDMNVVASRARALNAASDAFAAADGLQAIDATMIAPAPWLGAAGVGQGLDQWSIRASLDLEGEELARPIYMDIALPSNLYDYTKAELEDYAVAQMQARLDSYDEDALAALGIDAGMTITGLTDVQIMQL